MARAKVGLGPVEPNRRLPVEQGWCGEQGVALTARFEHTMPDSKGRNHPAKAKGLAHGRQSGHGNQHMRATD